MEKLYFVTGNRKKFKEMAEIIKKDGIHLDMYSMKIHEIQTDDIEELIKKKAFEAFKEIRRPLLVEHTMLKIDAFHQLPGPQTNYIYSRLGYQTIVEFCEYKNQFGAYAESVICYCDGKKYVTASAKERGQVRREIEEGCDALDWDIIFQPDSDDTEKKRHSWSMRAGAWETLRNRLGRDFLDQYSASSPGHRKAAIEPKDALRELAELIRQKKVMLFIGAGISRSVDMPLWDKLIESLLDEEYDADLLRTYGDNMMLAEFIRQRLKDHVYDKIREIFDINETIKEKLKSSLIYKMIADLDCPVIYTTNYDRLLEEYYGIQKKPYRTVVHVGDMYRIQPKETRIMKFHGDIEDDKSIVLAESEYFKRMDFQHFMDVQLQADMLRYHILFLGYSLSDVNIKMLLYMGRKRQESDCTMKSFIFTATPNQIQKEVFSDDQIVTFSGGYADKAQGTEDFLRTLYEAVKG